MKKNFGDNNAEYNGYIYFAVIIGIIIVYLFTQFYHYEQSKMLFFYSKKWILFINIQSFLILCDKNNVYRIKTNIIITINITQHFDCIAESF